MIIRVLGESNAQAVFDVFSRTGASCSNPTNKHSAWHTLKINVKPEQVQDTKAFILDCFPNVKFSFK